MLPVAMNIYYQNSGKSPSDCDFVQTAVLSSSNPSYTGCNYPGGTEAKMIMNITDGLQNKKVLSSVSTSLDSPIHVPAEQFLTLRAFDAPPIVIALAAIASNATAADVTPLGVALLKMQHFSDIRQQQKSIAFEHLWRSGACWVHHYLARSCAIVSGKVLSNGEDCSYEECSYSVCAATNKIYVQNLGALQGDVEKVSTSWYA
ncbi:hypothetical protein AgCh_005388 [Apium graveolens]